MAASPHSPTSTSDAEPQIDIASAMGFASFGAKPNPPKKKRKVDNSSISVDGSGSNNTPLGIRGRKQGGAAPRQQWGQREEKALGKGQSMHGEGDVKTWEGDGVMGKGVDGAVGAGYGKEGQGGTGGETLEFVDKGRAYIVGDEEVRTVYGNVEPVMAPPMHIGRWEGLQQAGTGIEPGKRADGEWDWQALRRGVRDEKGDLAFYDASFVEDPWRGLLGGKG
jgi:hypothetical protein